MFLFQGFCYTPCNGKALGTLPMANLDYSMTLKYLLLWIGIGGFLAATFIGSIAWYNSRKPAGWEDTQTPGWVPKMGTEAAEPADSERQG